MVELYTGRVTFFRPITKRSVQLELDAVPFVVELVVDEPWVLRRGDLVAVAGELDGRSGKFSAYAYRNLTRRVTGSTSPWPSRFACLIVLLITLFWSLAYLPESYWFVPLLPNILFLPFWLSSFKLGRAREKIENFEVSENFGLEAGTSR